MWENHWIITNIRAMGLFRILFSQLFLNYSNKQQQQQHQHLPIKIFIVCFGSKETKRLRIADHSIRISFWGVLWLIRFPEFPVFGLQVFFPFEQNNNDI